MKKGELSNLLENKKIVALFSVIAAIIAWVFVVGIGSSEKTMTVRGVPVQFSYNATVYTSLGLNVVQDREVVVDVVVEGPRNIIGNLSAEDFIVYPQYASVTGAGTYTLTLNAEKIDALANYRIVSVRSSSIQVQFDKFVVKKFLVETDLSSVQVAEGYIMGTGYTSPSEITLTGPESEMNEVSRVVARVELQGEQTTSAISAVTVELYDRNGNLLPQKHIQFDVQTVEMTVPILKMKELPFSVEFINVPPGFDVSSLNYTFSENSILLAGPENDVNAMESWEVGYIDLQSFQLGGEYTFEIELPPSYANINSVKTVTVLFSSEGLSTRNITVSDIRVINQPENYNIEVQTSRVSSVQFIGPSNELSLLSQTSIVAQIDAAYITIERGQQTVPVQFVIPSTDKVFASGVYTVLVNITPK
jgi:Uncharacterized protein conserved in bacteria